MFTRVRRLIRKVHERRLGISHYEVRFRRANERGWSRIRGDDFPGLRYRSSAPPAAEHVQKLVEEAEGDGWPSGFYQCYAIDSESNILESLWSLEIENEEWERAERRRERLAELDREIGRIEEMIDDGQLGRGQIDEIGEMFGATSEAILEDDLDDDQVEQLKELTHRWARTERRNPWE